MYNFTTTNNIESTANKRKENSLQQIEIYPDLERIYSILVSRADISQASRMFSEHNA